MKEITKYWKQTCIDFGRYVYSNRMAIHTDLKSMDEIWEQFQEQMAKDVIDVLDDVPTNDKINCLSRLVFLFGSSKGYYQSYFTESPHNNKVDEDNNTICEYYWEVDKLRGQKNRGINLK